MTVPVLSDAMIMALLNPLQLLEDFNRYFEQVAQRDQHSDVLRVPQRTLIFDGNPFSVMGAMPAYDQETGLFIVKSAIHVAHDDPNLSQPSVDSLISIFERQPGRAVAVLEGNIATGLRTAAVSTLITQRLLANRVDESTDKQLAIIGSGNLAFCHLMMMIPTLDFSRVVLYSRHREHADKMIARFKRWSAGRYQTLSNLPEIIVEDSVKYAVQEADVVVTATSSREPLIDPDWLLPGCHVNCVGGHSRIARELSHQLLAQSELLVENRAFAVSEAGDVHDKSFEVSEFLTMSEQDCAVFADRLSVFSSVGTAMLDLFFVKHLMQRKLF